MVATDGHRLALVEAENPLAAGEVNAKALVPRKAMNELLKLASETSNKDEVRRVRGRTKTISSSGWAAGC